MIKYSPYGSRLLNENERKGKGFSVFEPSLLEKQQEIKNSPNFYQEAPFLTIAEDLVKLLKGGKIDKLIFLSAYDKRKFPNGDERKRKIFKDTFGTDFSITCSLQLIGFDSEEKGQSKAD